MEGITKINWSIVSLDKIDSISKLFHNKSMIFFIYRLYDSVLWLSPKEDTIHNG
jgi:hypothetical protein